MRPSAAVSRRLPLKIALAVFFSTTLSDQDRHANTYGRPFSQTQDGNFVSFDGEKMLMTNRQGDECLIPLGKDVIVTCDGSVCTISEFWTGIAIRVTIRNKVAIRIDAIDRDAGSFAVL